MSYTEVKVVKLLKDNGFVGPDGALCPVEVDSNSSALYARKSWFGFGGWVLADFDSNAKVAKAVKTLVLPWGNALDMLEEGRRWQELKGLDSEAKWQSPVGLRNNKYSGLPEEVVSLALVTVHTVIDGEKEHILYALRANVSIPVSRGGISDLVSALKLFGVKTRETDKRDKPKTEKPKADRRDYRRDDRRDYRRGDREYYDRDYRGRGRR